MPTLPPNPAPSAESGVRRIRNLAAVVRHRHPELLVARPRVGDDESRMRLDDESQQRLAQADRQALADLNDWLAANGLRGAGWYLGDGSLVIEAGEIRGLEIVDDDAAPASEFPHGHINEEDELDTRPVAVPLLVEPADDLVAAPGELLEPW